MRNSRPSSPNRSRCRPAGRTPAARRSRRRSARSAGSLASSASSGTERHRKEGTSFSSIFFRRAGTPALRKYFWARMSAATWRELRRHVDVVEPEHDRAVRILDLRKRLAEFDLRIGRLTGLGETAFDAHLVLPVPIYSTCPQESLADSTCGASPILPGRQRRPALRSAAWSRSAARFPLERRLSAQISTVRRPPVRLLSAIPLPEEIHSI